MNLSLFKTIPVGELLDPPKEGTYMLIKQAYWLLDPDGNVYSYIGTTGRHNNPQCNRNYEIAKRMLQLAKPVDDRHVLVRLQSAFFPIDIRDYQHD